MAVAGAAAISAKTDPLQAKVADMVRSGQRAAHKAKVDDALRYYYWASLLLQTPEAPDSMTFNHQGTMVELNSWLPQQISALMDSVKVAVTEVNDDEATLFFTYCGKPATGLDFALWDGTEWGLLNHAKDGTAAIRVSPGVDARELKLELEYRYRNEMKIDSLLALQLAPVEDVNYDEATKRLSKEADLRRAVDKNARRLQQQLAEEAADISIEPLTDTKRYDRSIHAIIDSLSGRKSKASQHLASLFTPEGYEMMQRLLRYGQARLLGNQEYEFYDLGGGRVVCRSLRMTFSFPNNKKTFTEDVTFTFNADGLIECLAFGLGAEAKRDVFSLGGSVWKEKSKMAIVTFLENYKTAFALKRLDYVRSIFDDNAIIVVGHVVKPAQTMSNDMGVYMTRAQVEKTTLTKSQYLERLDRVFNSNEYINIRFANNDVVRMGKGGEYYTIQIRQDYYSSSYGDTGYLMLMVDLNNPDEPVIKVRTWQPERNPALVNGNLQADDPDYGLFSPGNFR